MDTEKYLNRTYWFVRQKDGTLAMCSSEEEAAELSYEIQISDAINNMVMRRIKKPTTKADKLKRWLEEEDAREKRFEVSPEIRRALDEYWAKKGKRVKENMGCRDEADSMSYAIYIIGGGKKWQRRV